MASLGVTGGNGNNGGLHQRQLLHIEAFANYKYVEWLKNAVPEWYKMGFNIMKILRIIN